MQTVCFQMQFPFKIRSKLFESFVRILLSRSQLRLALIKIIHVKPNIIIMIGTEKMEYSLCNSRNSNLSCRTSKDICRLGLGVEFWKTRVTCDAVLSPWQYDSPKVHWIYVLTTNNNSREKRWQISHMENCLLVNAFGNLCYDALTDGLAFI